MKRAENKGVELAETAEVETAMDSVFVGGILNENNDGTSVGPDPG